MKKIKYVNVVMLFLISVFTLNLIECLAEETVKLNTDHKIVIPDEPKHKNIDAIVKRVNFCVDYLAAQDINGLRFYPLFEKENKSKLIISGNLQYANKKLEAMYVFILPVDTESEDVVCSGLVHIFLSDGVVGSYTEFGPKDDSLFVHSGVGFYENGRFADMYCSDDDFENNKYLLWDEKGTLKSKVSDVKIGATFSNESLARFDKNKKTNYLPQIKLPSNIEKYKEKYKDVKGILQGIDIILTKQHENTYKFIYNICYPNFFKKTKSEYDKVNFEILLGLDGIEEFFVEQDTHHKGLYNSYHIKISKNQISRLIVGNMKGPSNPFSKLTPARIDGSGVEVMFHSTGYPATYKTIVKNRLFGRQIEWNDKGEVVSDIELDIPKEWKDAPKKIESESK
ncbi:MAG: hypothetical protein LBJ00_02790 [Planctomycetaceae bacterium]|jgi:hypothetical protein|nr:hypothetical protein [Planctomycetaceae bacterium]